jgi:hypothetical protein
MDEAVIRYYRRLLKTGFEHAGSFENPSIFLDTVGENIRICGNLTDYLHLYVNIRDERIAGMVYLCTCDPGANVAVEILCTLTIGRPLVEIGTLTEDTFCEVLGGESPELRGKASGLLKLLDRGLTRFSANSPRGDGETLSLKRGHE